MLGPPRLSITTRSPASLIVAYPSNGAGTTCVASTCNPEVAAFPEIANGATNVSGRGSADCTQPPSAARRRNVPPYGLISAAYVRPRARTVPGIHSVLQ